MQRKAREAINSTLSFPKAPKSAIVTVDPANGKILAMASSASYAQTKFNLAAQGRRQPGSTFKVMGLMAALKRGVSPEGTSYTSKPLKFNDPRYGPIETKTYDSTYGGRMNLVRATLKSDNSVYMQLGLDVGPEATKQAARDMGIKSTLKGYPAEILGGLERGVSPLEMANSYATIASGGMRNRPIAIEKVVFPGGDGKVVNLGKPRRTRAFQDGVTGQGDADPQAEHDQRHRRLRADRVPGGRQDRDDRRVHRRVVRRVHAEPVDRRVGRLPEHARRDEAARDAADRQRRLVPGADLGPVHEGRQARLQGLQVAEDRFNARRSSASTPTSGAPGGAGPAVYGQQAQRRRLASRTAAPRAAARRWGGGGGGGGDRHRRLRPRPVRDAAAVGPRRDPRPRAVGEPADARHRAPSSPAPARAPRRGRRVRPDRRVRARPRRPSRRAAVVRGPGDDAAVSARGVRGDLGRRRWSTACSSASRQVSPADAGHRALAGALSDLARWAPIPARPYVTLGLPPGFGEDAALGCVRAMADLAGRPGRRSPAAM
jgi:hypothetical protein